MSVALTSFLTPIHALVIGASGGIGGALVEALVGCDTVVRVTAWSRRPMATDWPKVQHAQVDVLDEGSVASAAAQLVQHPPTLAIVASGLLHSEDERLPEKTWRSLDAEALLRTFALNSIAPAMVAKHVLPTFPRHGKTVFAALSARVGSISDNRLGGWYGYRASKAALNMLIRTLSIELHQRWPDSVCVALHPGTVDTALSKPFQRQLREGQLVTPAQSARNLLTVIDSLDASRSGELIQWDGQTIPY